MTDLLEPAQGIRRHVRHDVQEGRDRAVPRGEEAHRAALPRPSRAQPAPRRAREVHRLRAVRLGLPGRRDLRRGRRQHRRSERFSPGERYGRVYQINYLRCIFCGLCIEACPTRALTMSNEYELADDSREELIFEKEDLLAPLMPGMASAAAPDGRGHDDRTTTTAGSPRPHPLRSGTSPPAHEQDADVMATGRRARDARGRATDTGTGEAVVFWLLAPDRRARRLGMVCSARRPCTAR